MLLMSPSDHKVKGFTQEKHAAQKGEDASKEENGTRRRRRHRPERDKAFAMAP